MRPHPLVSLAAIPGPILKRIESRGGSKIWGEPAACEDHPEGREVLLTAHPGRFDQAPGWHARSEKGPAKWRALKMCAVPGPEAAS